MRARCPAGLLAFDPTSGVVLCAAASLGRWLAFDLLPVCGRAAADLLGDDAVALILHALPGTALFTTVWENRAVLHHARLVETVDRGNSAAVQTMAQLTAAGMSTEQAMATITRSIEQRANTMAVNDLFWLSSALFLVLIGVVWLARPMRTSATDSQNTAGLVQLDETDVSRARSAAR